ncbi:hypothetical protein GCM10027059_30620 [Myceligenerans halotolerans]
MEWTAIVVSLISAAVAGVSLLNANRTESRRAQSARELAALEAEFKRADRLESRRENLETRLAMQREPLIEAVEDLQSRIWNIRRNGFLEKYAMQEGAHRHELAVLSTLYRLGKYFATVETVRRGVDTWTLEHDPATEGLAVAVREVSETLAADRYGELMVWREEQRAIGELMLHAASHTPIGFAEFATRYDDDFHRWFSALRDEFLRSGSATNARLERLDEELGTLHSVLVAGRHVEQATSR